MKLIKYSKDILGITKRKAAPIKINYKKDILGITKRKAIPATKAKIKPTKKVVLTPIKKRKATPTKINYKKDILVTTKRNVTFTKKRKIISTKKTKNKLVGYRTLEITNVYIKDRCKIKRNKYTFVRNEAKALILLNQKFSPIILRKMLSRKKLSRREFKVLYKAINKNAQTVILYSLLLKHLQRYKSVSINQLNKIKKQVSKELKFVVTRGVRFNINIFDFIYGKRIKEERS